MKDVEWLSCGFEVYHEITVSCLDMTISCLEFKVEIICMY